MKAIVHNRYGSPDVLEYKEIDPPLVRDDGVLRIFSGDATSGKMGNLAQFSQGMWLGIAVLMVIPIVMVVLVLFLPQPINRWANIVVAVGFFLFNVVGLPTYPGAYDKFLQVVGLGFNVLTVWVAWKWV
jgi:hypothetical protein